MRRAQVKMKPYDVGAIDLMRSRQSFFFYGQLALFKKEKDKTVFSTWRQRASRRKRKTVLIFLFSLALCAFYDLVNVSTRRSSERICSV
jgi:hypothetical protein